MSGLTYTWVIMVTTMRTNVITQRLLRACLQGGGGPQVGEVTHFGGVTHLSPVKFQVISQIIFDSELMIFMTMTLGLRIGYLLIKSISS